MDSRNDARARREYPKKKPNSTSEEMSHKVLSPFLLERLGIRYAIANEKFVAAIINLLSECSSREPVSSALGLSARELASVGARLIPECTNNGLSVIAMPADHSETLAGAFICRDFKSPLPCGRSARFSAVHSDRGGPDDDR
jgi:hypothetical protein